MKQIKNTTYTYIPQKRIEELKQFIRGSILGDGHLEFSSKFSKNARIKFCHGEKQKEYISWKKDFLKSFDLATESEIHSYKAISERYKKGYCETFSFCSKTHPLFTEYKNLYYKNNKRILDKKDIAQIDEFALAIWYMDDGYVFNRNKRSSKIALATCSFTKEDISFLMEILWNKWQIKTSYYKTSNEILISVYDSQKFIDLVKPYIQKCLSYKAELVHIKSCELLENPEMDNQQPSTIEI